MKRQITKGKCKFCSKLFAGSAMGRHLQACESRALSIQTATEVKGSNNAVFLIKASAGPFWLFIEADSSAKLKDLDSFLRDIWLECCGHLSCFTIHGAHFNSQSSPDLPGKGMKFKLADVLMPGIIFEHEYDFGSTTHLQLKVISFRPGRLKYPVELISRNEPLEFNCVTCGKKATDICTECSWDREPWYCESCLKKHECGEEMALPIVNSPRMGECGYTGED